MTVEPLFSSAVTAKLAPGVKPVALIATLLVVANAIGVPATT